MLLYLFLLLIVLPLVEVLILVKIGMLTNIWVPIAIVVVTGIVGTALARREGWKVLERIQADVRQNRMPADSLLDGFCVLLAGLLFLLPGVLTDVVGIVLLIPPTRDLVKRGAAAWLKRHVQVSTVDSSGDYWSSSSSATLPGQDKIIDARVINTRVEEIRKPR